MLNKMLMVYIQESGTEPGSDRFLIFVVIIDLSLTLNLCRFRCRDRNRNRRRHKPPDPLWRYIHVFRASSTLKRS